MQWSGYDGWHRAGLRVAVAVGFGVFVGLAVAVGFGVLVGVLDAVALGVLVGVEELMAGILGCSRRCRRFPAPRAGCGASYVWLQT